MEVDEEKLWKTYVDEEGGVVIGRHTYSGNVDRIRNAREMNQLDDAIVYFVSWMKRRRPSDNECRTRWLDLS